MRYTLRFHVLALIEWVSMDNIIREQLKKKMAERLANPSGQASALAEMSDCYKIKRLRIGYRLVYRVKKKPSSLP